MSFHGSIAHFFLALNEIPLSGHRSCFCFVLFLFRLLSSFSCSNFSLQDLSAPTDGVERRCGVVLAAGLARKDVASQGPKAALPPVPNRWPQKHPVLASFWLAMTAGQEGDLGVGVRERDRKGGSSSWATSFSVSPGQLSS